jgi:hypothetical protein
MPYLAEKLHLWRVERIVFGEFELGGEDAAFKGRALGALDQRLPGKEVVFVNGAGGDAVGWGREERFVFREEAL